MTVVSSAMISWRIVIGFGVVMITVRGSGPIRTASIRLSQVSRAYFQAASSSHKAVSNCGPRSSSGFSPEKVVALAPLGHVTRRFDGS